MKNPTIQPRPIEIVIPPEVQSASMVLQSWFMKQHIKDWQLNGVCSRQYAFAIQEHVPRLHCFKEPDLKNGDGQRQQEHNQAVKALRSMVASK